MANALTLDGLATLLAAEPKSGTVRHSTIVRVNRIAECRNSGEVVTVTESGRDGNARKSTAVANAYRKLIGDADDIRVVPLRQAGRETECLLVPAGMYADAMAKVA